MTRRPDRDSPFRSAALLWVAAAGVAGAVTALLLGGAPAGAQSDASPPQNTALPSIAGQAQQGSTLSATSGSWAGSTPIDFGYQWLRCDAAGAACDEIAGATGGNYVLIPDDVGKRMRVEVTATNTAGSATVRSGPTAAVAAGTRPVNVAEPSISGTAIEGAPLTASAGSWTSTTQIAYAYAWLRCGADGGAPDGSNCTAIAGAAGTTYVLQRADVGRRLRVRVTATNSFGALAALSNPTGVVTTAAPTSTREPFVTGTPRQGQRLTANTGSWAGLQPLGLALQWLRCDGAGNNCVAIGGQTASSYLLAAADVNTRVRVRVTATNRNGSATSTSNPTALVQAASASQPSGAIRLSDGRVSVPASSVSLPARLIISDVKFSPTVVRSRQTPIELRVRVTDTEGHAVRDALVFVRSTPVVTSGASNQRTGQDGWVTIRLMPQADLPVRRGYAVQFFVRARKSGDDVLAGVSTRRLVQVKTAR
jgi:hypothetical protein